MEGQPKTLLPLKLPGGLFSVMQLHIRNQGFFFSLRNRCYCKRLRYVTLRYGSHMHRSDEILLVVNCDKLSSIAFAGSVYAAIYFHTPT